MTNDFRHGLIAPPYGKKPQDAPKRRAAPSVHFGKPPTRKPTLDLSGKTTPTVAKTGNDPIAARIASTRAEEQSQDSTDTRQLATYGDVNAMDD